MPFSVVLEGIPAGYASNAVKKGDQANIIVREFTSSEDGDIFISRLEGFPLELISRLPAAAKISPSSIDQLLAIIYPDKTATIYINEFKNILQVRVKRNKSVGDAIYDDDIADILRLSFDGVVIPNDCGVAFIFSIGWRKGFFYDFGPLANINEVRDYEPEEIFGHYYAYLNRQHLFKITDQEWGYFFDQQWFPFITLRSATIKRMISYLRSGWLIDELLPDIADEIMQSIEEMRDRWSKDTFIQPHFDIVQHAINRYIVKDYISTVSILYSKIEGIMRSVLLTDPHQIKATQTNLVSTIVDVRSKEFHQYSSLLPAIFQEFMTKVYFANFDPNKPAKLSRNSIAHGVAETQDYSLKGATIGLLILDQIFFYLP